MPCNAIRAQLQLVKRLQALALQVMRRPTLICRSWHAEFILQLRKHLLKQGPVADESEPNRNVHAQCGLEEQTAS